MTVGRQRFTATLQGSANGASAFVVMPDVVKVGPKQGLVKVRGTIDGLAFHSSFTATPAGRARLTVRPDICRRLGKRTGDRVTVVIHH
ncbi:MAG: DUF1905 domain-containing protein [Acidimicrobiia bacterium]